MKKEVTKMDEQEIKDFDELYQYIRGDLLKYGNLPLSKNAVLRIKGLREGKQFANKNSKSFGEYQYREILITAKICRAKLESYLSNEYKFKDENHKINGIFYIIEGEINNVVLKLRKEKLKEKKIDNVDLEEYNVSYVQREPKKINNKLKDLW